MGSSVCALTQLTVHVTGNGLARTGSATTGLAILGLLLVAGGAALVRLSVTAHLDDSGANAVEA